jgi:alkyl hydroperoxide reductase subunit AhpF
MDLAAPDALIRHALADLPAPVTLISYTSDVESWYSRAERELLERVATASDRITLQIRAERWDAARETAAGIRRTPCLAVVGDAEHGIHYYGLPDGYELETFLGVVRAVSERRSGLAPRTIERLRAVSTPIHLEVFALPT